MNTQTIALDVSKATAVPPTIHIRQGDKNGTVLNVGIFDNGTALSLTGYAVRLCAKLPDNEHYYSVNGTADGNTAAFAIDESYAAAYPGATDVAYVDVLDGDTVICSTQPFRLVVEPGAREGVVPSEQQISEIDAAVERANAAAEAAEEIVENFPVMDADTVGGAKLGDGLSVDANDALNVAVGSGIAIEGGTVSLGPLTASGSGSTVQTDGCALYSVDGKGWSEQDTTTGKNLNAYGYSTTISGVSIAYDGTGKVSVSGTAAEAIYVPTGSFAYSNGFMTLLAAGTYTISASSLPNGVSATVINNSGNTLAQTSGSPASFTLASDTYVCARVVIASGASVNADIFIQLEEGSTATSYEPYTGGKPSPSPDYPQEIRVCRGRNLLPSAAAGSWSNNGVTLDSDGKGTYRAHGTSTAGVVIYVPLQSSGAPIEAGDYYHLRNSVASGDTVLSLCENGSSSFSDPALTPVSRIVELTGSTRIGKVPAYIKLYVASGKTIDITMSPSIEKSATETPYVPYGHVGLEVQSCNLLPHTDQTRGGYTYTQEPNGIKVSGTASSTYYYPVDNSSTATIRLKAGTYTFDNGGVGPSTCSIHMNKLVNGSMVNMFTNKASKTFTLEEDADVSPFCTFGPNASGEVFAIQLVGGSSVPSYQPYSHQVCAVPLPAKGWAGAVGSYADALAIDSAGRWEWTSATAEAVFDGSSDEDWTVYSYNAYEGYFINALDANKTRASGYCSIAPVLEEPEGTGGLQCWLGVNSKYIFIIGANSVIGSTVSDMKTWLSAHNVTVMYPLGTPTTEHGYIDLPELPNGATVSIPELESIGASWLVEGARPIAEHVSNVRRYIESLIAELATQ